MAVANLVEVRVQEMLIFSAGIKVLVMLLGKEPMALMVAGALVQEAVEAFGVEGPVQIRVLQAVDLVVLAISVESPLEIHEVEPRKVMAMLRLHLFQAISKEY